MKIHDVRRASCMRMRAIWLRGVVEFAFSSLAICCMMSCRQFSCTNPAVSCPNSSASTVSASATSAWSSRSVVHAARPGKSSEVSFEASGSAMSAFSAWNLSSSSSSIHESPTFSASRTNLCWFAQ